MTKIKIPSEYSFSKECLELLLKHTREYIIYQNERYVKDDITVYLHDIFLKIKYHNHYYNVAIISKSGLFYYYLSPYNKTYFVTMATSANNFEILIQAIKDHDNMFLKKKKD